MNFTRLLIILFALALFSCEKSELVTNSELVESPTLMELAQEISASTAYQNYLEFQESIFTRLRNGYAVEQDLLELEHLFLQVLKAFPKVNELDEAKIKKLVSKLVNNQIGVRSYESCLNSAQAAFNSCLILSLVNNSDAIEPTDCAEQYAFEINACDEAYNSQGGSPPPSNNTPSEPSNPPKGRKATYNPGDNTDCDTQCREAAIEAIANDLGLDASDIDSYVFDLEQQFINASSFGISGLGDAIENELGIVGLDISFVQSFFDQDDHFNAALELVIAVADIVPPADLDNALYTLTQMCYNSWC